MNFTFERERDRLLGVLEQITKAIAATKAPPADSAMERMKQRLDNEIAVAIALEILGEEVGKGYFARSLARRLVKRVTVLRGTKFAETEIPWDEIVHNNNFNVRDQQFNGAHLKVSIRKPKKETEGPEDEKAH